MTSAKLSTGPGTAASNRERISPRKPTPMSATPTARHGHADRGGDPERQPTEQATEPVQRLPLDGTEKLHIYQPRKSRH